MMYLRRLPKQQLTRSAGRVMPLASWFALILLVLIGMGSFARSAHALLPEPPNIIYGKADSGVRTVTARLDGVVIASYIMGSNPNLPGNIFMLMVPLDALNPQTPGTARPGNVVDIYFGETVVASATIDVRGTVILIAPKELIRSFLLWTR